MKEKINVKCTITKSGKEVLKFFDGNVSSYKINPNEGYLVIDYKGINITLKFKK